MRTVIPSGWGRSGRIACIPARNEAERLPCALAALAVDGVIGDVVVVANGCLDRTADVVRTGRAGLAVALVETGPLPGGVGEARRIGFAFALRHSHPGAVLLSTDADCRVRPGFGIAMLHALERADAACGRVEPDPAEFRNLPRMVREYSDLENRVSDLTCDLENLLRPRPYNPRPNHLHAPGAAMAFRAGAYRHCGGFDPVRCHEDRRILARMTTLGLNIAHPAAMQVIASCRLTGRAPGGMADTIADRVRSSHKLKRKIAEMKSRAVRLELEISALRSGLTQHDRDDAAF